MAMMPSPGRLPKPPGSGPVPPGPTPASPLDAEHLRLWSEPASGADSGSAPAPSSAASALEAVLEEFTRRWDRGESPRAEDFLDRLPPEDPEAALELVYHEFCLLASSGRRPSPDDLVRRFPAYRDRLLRLIALHDALPPLGDDAPEGPVLPESGDVIGPYRLIRELGRGGFARVYLAADAELEDRLLVVKVTDRPSAEHRYLARAPHPHIVPILRERTTDDGLQLIFMPFVGGGTLADVLAEGRLRARRPERGADLLTALDLRSAPEYAAAAPVRPAREIIASLTYPQAVAWLVARLAEGLDHAYRRGVTHGDLKPSNVLIGGDGQPMLLDFNLSSDWRPATPSTASGEPGGTLAYMAPERLRALAEPELASPPCPVARHRADLYALGLILREALTGTPPFVPSPSEPPRSGRALAAMLAAERSAGDPTSRRLLASIPPGLRVILRRCLSPDPADRYAHASHLASDLDRWRAGLPLIYATPPRWVEAARWARRRRAPLLATVLCLSIGIACSSAAARVQDALAGRDARYGTLHARSLEQAGAMTAQAHSALERLWTDPESGAYGLWDYNRLHAIRDLSPAERADRFLRAYGFLGDPAGEAPWERPDVRALDEPEASEFVAWISEQALRFALATLGPEYDGFPEDRREALDALDRVAARYPAEPIVTVSALLRERLGIATTDPPAPRPVPSWLCSYIEGVLAESISPAEAVLLGVDVGQIGLERALDHYAQALSQHPDSYWAHYRAASVLNKLGRFGETEAHLQACIDQRPECAALWNAKGGSSFYDGEYEKAIAACQQAIRLAPRFQESYRSLAVIGASLGKPELIEPAMERHRHLSMPLGTAPWKELQLEVSLASSIMIGAPLDDAAMWMDRMAEGLVRDEDDVDLRFAMANELYAEGRLDEAASNYSRVIEIDPDHLGARFNRAIISQRKGITGSALDDYEVIAKHPNAPGFIEQVPDALLTYVIVSADRIRHGQSGEAVRLAEFARKCADQSKSYLGETHYALARAHASAASSDPTQLSRVAEHLVAARKIHPSFIKVRFVSDPLFSDMQAELAELIGGIEF